MIEKVARLFRAGNYEDKKVNVSTEAIDNLCANFSPVPIKIEHTNTAFDGKTGQVERVFRCGEELFGILNVDKDMWNVIEKFDTKKLSVGLKKDLSAITEVSIVKTPRVADAEIFCFNDDAVFADLKFEDSYNTLWDKLNTSLADNQYVVDFGDNWVVYNTNGVLYRVDYAELDGKIQLGSEPKTVTVTYDVVEMSEKGSDNTKENENMGNSEETKDFSALSAEIEALKAENLDNKIEFAVTDLIKQGKITPAGKDLAKAIMASSADTINFSGENKTVADLFIQFLDTQPKNPVIPSTGNALDNDVPNADPVFSGDTASKLFEGLGITTEKVMETMKNNGGAK